MPLAIQGSAHEVNVTFTVYIRTQYSLTSVHFVHDYKKVLEKRLNSVVANIFLSTVFRQDEM